MTIDYSNLWGLVLAGGEGKRLQNCVYQLRGNFLPKQYVNFVGTRSMLEHTFQRVERLIPRQRILTVVGEYHLQFGEVRRQLSDRPRHTVVVQPANKDTGPGILLPLTYLCKRCPDATVAVFPSDHFILQEERFIDYVDLAAHAVYSDPQKLVLLAMEAERPETEYGYVVAADNNGDIDMCGCLKAIRFVEKPDLAEAESLVAAGALWNTMIMVFRATTFLDRIKTLYPEVASRFRSLAEVIGANAEKDKLQEIYRRLHPLNFSKDIIGKILTSFPAAIWVLPVLQVTWSDWGSPQRLFEMKESLGLSVNRSSPAVQSLVAPGGF